MGDKTTDSLPMSTGKVILYGLLTWAIPFAVSVPLMGRDGRPVVPVGVFKSTMVVVGSAVGAWLLVQVLRRRPAYKSAGLIVGLIWLWINLGLDLLVLVPLAGMSWPDYFGEIGLRYLVIPIMGVAIDAAAGPVADGRGQPAGPDPAADRGRM